MVIDSSAIIAWMRNEPEADRIEDALDSVARLRMSAFNVFECRGVLLRRFGEAAVGEFDVLLMRLGVAIEPFGEEQAELALDAYRRYGKGSAQGAGLNLGDCAAYALARACDLPLLFVGDDFTQTDIRSVLC